MPAYKDSKTGTWYYSYKKRDPVSGEWKNHKKRGFSTRRDALAAEREALNNDLIRTRATFRKMWILWEDYRDSSQTVRDKHRQAFEKRFDKYLDMPIDDLTKPVLSRYRAELAKDDSYSTTTKNSTMTFIKGVLKFAHDVYGLPDNSVILQSFRKTNEEILKEFDVWTPEEFNQFIQAVDNPLYQIMFTCYYWTGARRGELIGLQKSEIGDHTITFKYSQIDQKAGLKPVKGRQARTIQIDDILFTQLQPLLKEPGNYVFGGECGIDITTLRNNFRKGISKSGVKPIRIHDLRHSHATWLINNGVNVVAVSKRLGHKDISTTLKVYTHLLEATDNAMMDKINQFKSK